MMSLGGLALAIGMLVDNSIVVIENIFRHRYEQNEPVNESAIWGTSEVATAITASTLTTIVVFLPILFVPGIAREIFKDQAWTVILSLLVSLFVALSLVPMLATKFFREWAGFNIKPGKFSRIKTAIDNIFEKLNSFYENALRWAMGHKKTVVFGVLAIFIISVMMIVPFHFVGTEFMPKMDQGEIRSNVELPVGTKLEVTTKAVMKIEDIIRLSVPEIKLLYSSIGSGGFVGGLNPGQNTAEVTLQLVDIKERERSQWDITADLRKILSRIPGVQVTVGGADPGMAMMGFGGSPIAVEIYGHDLDKAVKLAEEVKAIIEKVPGTVEVDVSLEKSKPELQVIINRKKAADFGLSVVTISKTLQSYIKGTMASIYREGGDEFPITVRLKEEDRTKIEELYNIPIATPRGQIISAGSFIELKPALGPTTINRKKQERVVTVSSGYERRDLGSVTRNVSAELKKLVLPQGFFIKISGEAKEQAESFMWLGLALLGAIFLIYAVMSALFESLIDPFIIMFTFPLSLIGVIWLFFFTGTNLSIIGIIGVILLAGIIVNNGIVLVDYINLMRARGLPLKEAIIVAGKNRLRPVLMTATTTVIALLPMALGIGEGAEFMSPLAKAVAGGLTIGTFLTLIFIPVMYSIFETRIKGRIKKWRK
jgi:HAE1 family hydrophobic/amphiphilic exporter-1